MDEIMAEESKYTILVVDDESSNLAVLNKILSPKYTVLTAKSGETALKRIDEASPKPDLVMLDVEMPGLDGFEVLERLRANPVTKDIPVIIISGLSGENDEEKGLFLGAVDYIAKPFKATIVLARVNTHIRLLNQLRTIENLGMVDPLTSIPNRRSFDSRMDLEWRRCMREQKPISFLMLDVDRFKGYNDTYGHPQGDVLLKTIAKIFVGAARRPADLAARIGGEEFGVLLPDTPLENALYIAERLRAEVEAVRLATADGKVITQTTVSVGVATAYPVNGSKIEDFIAVADKNLYYAKNTGRNKVCHMAR
ncbi:MAG: diguanylate cyclase [Clostridiales Family XIII bacterium]|nr:diguanylate cyclase [Clostridiales Family XIII bacterium]